MPKAQENNDCVQKQARSKEKRERVTARIDASGEDHAKKSSGGKIATIIIRLRRLYFMVHGVGGFGVGAEGLAV